ncbi:MAG: 16S rRNA (cytosine(1402)-N(4))-methyltransferase RsmH [Thermosulfidibacteraceae bacterium]|jgi:16S rRNA (cytosine1402-N4)-methyltransferase
MVSHRPVLVEDIILNLLGYQGGIIVDATCGEGGHSEYILERVKPSLLVAMDQDIEILQIARERLKGYDNVKFVYGNFARVDEFLHKEGIKEVSAILMDLGVSSYHLEEAERGFSLYKDGPLDMRLDRAGNILTAYRVVNEYPPKKLECIIREYGEEKWAKAIVRAIVERRKERPIRTTGELREIIEKAVPKRFWPKKIHPATKTFQAIRIEVNRELESLKEALERSVKLLRSGGRLLVISFHSLEDRIVKNFFKKFEKSGVGSVLTKKPIVPSEREVQENRRARSAKLRILEKL